MTNIEECPSLGRSLHVSINYIWSESNRGTSVDRYRTRGVVRDDGQKKGSNL